jgi:hypothetical protein
MEIKPQEEVIQQQANMGFPFEQMTKSNLVTQGEAFYEKSSLSDMDKKFLTIRTRILQLVSIEKPLVELVNLKEKRESQIGVGIKPKKRKMIWERPTQTNLQTDMLGEELQKLEIDRVQMNQGDKIGYEQRIEQLESKTDLLISNLFSQFVSAVYASFETQQIIQSTIERIGHREIKAEAFTHLRTIIALEKNIDRAMLSGVHFDFMSSVAIQTIATLREIEFRRNEIEELIYEDLRRTKQTTIFVIVAMIIGILGVAGFITFGTEIWQKHMDFVLGKKPLSDYGLPILGVPWPVILWSFLGSFVAMLYRFNKMPIYDFGDALKWLLTRPIQGIVLALALYLIMVSGGVVFTGATSLGKPADSLILLLSFLIGFSDRFGDAVFEAVISKYAPTAKQIEENEGRGTQLNPIQQTTQTEPSQTKYTSKPTENFADFSFLNQPSSATQETKPKDPFELLNEDKAKMEK